MEKLLKPHWFIITVTIPQIFIFLIFWKIYSVINTEIKGENLNAWVGLGIGLWVLCGGFTIYSIILYKKSRNVNPISGIFVLASYILFLGLFFIYSHYIIPSSIQSWMIFDLDPVIIVSTLIMPSLAYGMILLVIRFSPDIEKYRFWKDISFSLLIPAFWYLMYVVLLPAIFGTALALNSEVLNNVLIILFITSTVVFLFMITRIVFMLLKKKSSLWKKIVIPIVLVMPVAGLLLNERVGNVLGNFSGMWFYVVAIVNGILIVIPELSHKKLRILLFGAKSITFSYTLYFFIVFLPYLPLSIVAIIGFGAGFLMLTPIALMLIHTKELWNDFMYLNSGFKKPVLWGMFVLGFLVIPSIITFTYTNDKININQALNMVYRQDLGNNHNIKINISGVERVLNNVKTTTNRRSILSANNTIPYLGTYYRWLVLDNLTLSQDKIKKLQNIFLGDKVEESTDDSIVNEQDSLRIKQLNFETIHEKQHGYYRSNVSIEIENQSSSQNEYSSVFTLPCGVYISDYYLYVNGVKKHGLIADKRAANWIYRQIVNFRKDPGILSYLSDGRISFRIFPFAPYETRKTGIEFIHKNPMNFSFDGQNLILIGIDGKDTEKIEIGEDITVVPGNAKKDLTEIVRKQKYYFMLDYSKNTENLTKEYIKRVKDYVKIHNIKNEDVEIVALNYNEIRVRLDSDNWEGELEKFPSKGGFFVDLAIKRKLYNNYMNNLKEYPAFVLVTNDLNDAILSFDMGGFVKLLPDTEKYYHLGKSGSLYEYSLLKDNRNKVGTLIRKVTQKSVLPWPDKDKPLAYLSKDNNDSIVLNRDIKIENFSMDSSLYKNGIILEAMEMNLTLYPQKFPEKTRQIVKRSIQTGIMSTLTSYIVLETEAQEKVLLEKQKQILSTNSALDIGERTSMPEPSLIILGLGLFGFLLIRNYKMRVIKRVLNRQ